LDRYKGDGPIESVSMKKDKQVMSVVRGQWSVAKGYKREDRRQMAGGKNIKTILPS